MTTLTVATINGIRTAHTWRRCEPDSHNESLCYVCDGGLSVCSVCNGAEGTLATHCPGPSTTSNDLILSLVYHGGLDYVNGAWIWRRDAFIYRNDIHTIFQVEHRGSIDRFIEYAANRMNEVQEKRTRDEREAADKRLTVSIKRYEGKVGA